MNDTGRRTLSHKRSLTGVLLLLLFPGALLLALPEENRTPAESRGWFQMHPDATEPGLLYSGPLSFSLPIVVPLESAIGRRHLGRSAEIHRPRMRIGLGSLSAYPSYFRTLAPYSGFIPPNLRQDLVRLGWTYYAGRINIEGNLDYTWTPGFDGFDPGDSLHAELFAGYAAAGLPAKAAAAPRRPPVNLRLGLTADFHNADIYRDEELANTAYGTVFLAPGLQLAGRRLLFEATVELPLRRSRHVPDRYRDKVRGNIGMKYFLQ